MEEHLPDDSILVADGGDFVATTSCVTQLPSCLPPPATLPPVQPWPTSILTPMLAPLPTPTSCLIFFPSSLPYRFAMSYFVQVCGASARSAAMARSRCLRHARRWRRFRAGREAGAPHCRGVADLGRRQRWLLDRGGERAHTNCCCCCYYYYCCCCCCCWWWCCCCRRRYCYIVCTLSFRGSRDRRSSSPAIAAFLISLDLF